MFRHRRVLWAASLCALALAGCNEHPLKTVRLQSQLEIGTNLPVHVNRDVDILFVIDNSRSMADEQRILSANFERFIAALEHEDVRANYRIGVTTTDVGNPACLGQNHTSPENGKLQISSCRDRLDQFEFPGDDQRDACLSVCPREGFETTPTVALDGERIPRRWLENNYGELNVPSGWNAAEAFGCFGPQGIVGCGFESPLEAMRNALSLTDDANSHSYGFLRDDAILAVVLVTDEYDCSHNPEFREIFTTANDQFLPDGANGPTSAICWHAGVSCRGDGQPFEACHSVDLDIHGNPVDPDAAEDQAVLHPVSRYVDVLRDIERRKQHRDPNQRVIVSVLSGVPRGYATLEEELYYVEAQSEDQAEQFAVEPGCVGDQQQAYPPVRLREFAESFPPVREDRSNLYSICADDYSGALDAVADEIIEQLRPGCFPGCARDLDPHREGLQSDCKVVATGEGEDISVPECERDDDGHYVREDDRYVVPPGSDQCYALRTDPDGEVTPDPHDDLHPDCTSQGRNLQFDVERHGGSDLSRSSDLEVSCQLSPTPDLDCPRARM
ncbi:MAG: VWA domain-containing protein [Myxococcales bacterium FL481]|nr:MAG: VWA domain-containing protein [Myxococcales bacterium FL481]